MTKRHEGTGPMQNGRLMPYHDSVGKLTIGYGRNIEDTGVTPEEALYLLQNDLEPPEVFKRRCKSAHYLNYCGPIAGYFAARLLESRPTVQTADKRALDDVADAIKLKVQAVLPADDPWWQIHYPPNDFGCRCGVIQLSADHMRAAGKDIRVSYSQARKAGVKQFLA